MSFWEIWLSIWLRICSFIFLKIALFQLEFSIFHTENMDTDFPEGYIEVSSISYKKIWSQIFPQEICKLHVSFKKTWVEIFLHGIWSFPYCLQENLGTYENMGNTFLEWTPFESFSKEIVKKIYNGTNYHNVGLVKCGFILAFWTIFILLVN